MKIVWGYFRYHESLTITKTVVKNWEVRNNLIDKTPFMGLNE